MTDSNPPEPNEFRCPDCLGTQLRLCGCRNPRECPHRGYVACRCTRTVTAAELTDLAGLDPHEQ